MTDKTKFILFLVILTTMFSGCMGTKNSVVVKEEYQKPETTLFEKEEDFVELYIQNESRIKNYIKDFLNYRYKERQAEEYAKYIVFASLEYDVDIDILLSLIKNESSFRPTVIHEWSGCIGSTQVNPNVWGEELKAKGIIQTEEDLLKIGPNIMSGAYILSHYFSITGDMDKALRRYFGISPYAPRYSKKILAG